MVPFAINAEPLLIHEIEEARLQTNNRKARLKRRAISMIALGAILYLTTGISAYLYKEALISLQSMSLMLAATLAWFIYSQLLIRLSREYLWMALSGMVTVSLIPAVVPLPPQSIEWTPVLVAFNMVILFRWLFENSREALDTIADEIYQLRSIPVDEVRMVEKLKRLRAISDSIDGYLHKVDAIDRPLLVGEYEMLLEQYDHEQKSSPLMEQQQALLE